jgi:diguanylate cyclase (GGDEF)-like protein
MPPVELPAQVAATALQRPFQPLHKRIIGWQVFYCAMTALVIASAQLFYLFIDKRAQALDIIESAAATHLSQLSWHLQKKEMIAIRLSVEAMARYPKVGYAILTLPSGEQIKAGEHAERSGDSLLDRFSSWSAPVPDPLQPERSLAQLRIFADREALHHALLLDALLIFGCQALGTLLLAVFMARIQNRLVGRHLTHIARHISVLNPAALGRRLSLSRRPKPWHDEFDQVSEAFNHLNARLVTYIDAHRTLESELREHRDGLTELVGQRTQSLERLRDFHGLIIAMLTRLMNLPAAEANAAVDQGLAAFCKFFKAPRCILFTHEDATRGFRIANAWPVLEIDSDKVEVWLAADTIKQDTRGARGARIWLSIKSPESVDNGSRDDILKLLDASACTVVGVEIMDRTVGLLCLIGQALAPTSEDARLLELAARVAANMLDHKIAQTRLLETQQTLEKVNLELHQLSHFDALTGLANRRRFDEVRTLEFSRALRSETPLAVLMCDIDHFKLYNDTYGHAQGDRCLQTLALCLTNLFARAGELPARLGGEEFAVLLPGASAELAQAQAERLRQTIWDLRLPHSGSPAADRVTISIGVACLKHGRHVEFDELLQAADEALYRAKKYRNRVALAE